MFTSRDSSNAYSDVDKAFETGGYVVILSIFNFFQMNFNFYLFVSLFILNFQRKILIKKYFQIKIQFSNNIIHQLLVYYIGTFPKNYFINKQVRLMIYF